MDMKKPVKRPLLQRTPYGHLLMHTSNSLYWRASQRSWPLQLTGPAWCAFLCKVTRFSYNRFRVTLHIFLLHTICATLSGQ